MGARNIDAEKGHDPHGHEHGCEAALHHVEEHREDGRAHDLNDELRQVHAKVLLRRQVGAASTAT